MAIHWVTLTIFDALLPAEIIRGRLKMEGVSCMLVDRSLLGIGIVAGGIELQVPESELEQAQAILKQDFSGELDNEL